MRSYKDKVVLITGGAGGIGHALARCFGAAGARIGLLDLPGQRLDDASADLTAEGIDVLALACDVTSEAECADAVARATERWGGIDVLINNAGIVHRSAFSDTDVDVIRRVMDVNFLGSVVCTKAALDSLVSRQGQIIVISSVAGVVPLLGRAGYSASKHALHGFFESLRAELVESGVHVLIVCPGFVDSGFDDRAIDGHGKKHKRSRSKVGDLATTDTVAEIIFNGARRQRRRLLLTPIGKISYALAHLVPGIYERLMSRSLRSELQSPEPAPPAS